MLIQGCLADTIDFFYKKQFSAVGFRCQSLSAKRFMDVSEPKLEEHKLLRIQIISRHVVHSVVIVMFGSRNGLVFFLYCCRSWFPGQQCVMFVVAIIVTDGAIVIVVTVVIIVVIRVVIIVVSCCSGHPFFGAFGCQS